MRFVKIFILFLLLIFSSSVVNSIVSVTTECNENNIIMRLSDPDDAHGSKWDYTSYNNYVCDSDAGTHECNGDNLVLKLDEEINAHGYPPTSNIEGYNVCYSNFVNCNVNNGACSENSFCVVKLDDTDDSHIYPCTNDEASISVCCSKMQVTQEAPAVNNRRRSNRDSSIINNTPIVLNPEQPDIEPLNTRNQYESNNDITSSEDNEEPQIENKSKLYIYILSGIGLLLILAGLIYYFKFRKKGV